MPTLAQLQREVWWNNEFVPPFLAELIIKLRKFYQVPAGNIGSKGDQNHLRGYHRSRNWIKNSVYCTNRTYSVSETPGNRTGGNSDWLAAIDITIPRDQLLLLCQRLDAGVRSGRFEKITEWYGNKDGDTRVDGYDNIRNQIASSDDSHLFHCHISFDRAAVGLKDHDDVYQLLTGDDVNTEQDALLYNASSVSASIARMQETAPVKRPDGTLYPEPLDNQIVKRVNSLTTTIIELGVKLDQVLALLNQEPPPAAGSVNLTPEAVQQVADAVVNEEKERLES